MTTDFFKQLSMYYDKENDLSNVTCAMCNSSEFFKEKFIHFFFPELDVAKITSIQREVCDEDNMHSRVDMFITLSDDDKPYLIEVKIYDENHHFGQYEAAYKVSKDRLGYITNYICTEGIEKGYDVKTWNEWYDALKSSISAIDNNEEAALCTGYLEYVKQVCGFYDAVTSLQFDEESEKSFIQTLRLAIKYDKHLVNPHITRQYSEPLEYNVITFMYDDDKQGGFAGLIYNKGVPSICIGYSKTLPISANAYNVLFNNIPQSDEWFGELIKTKFFSSPTVILPMSEAQHEAFVDSKTSNEQVNILRTFIDKAVDYIAFKNK